MQIEPMAPGAPGIPPRWTASGKHAVGTALTAASRVWFTVGHGILNEVYYPRIDNACIRDLGLLVTDGRGFFSEERRQTSHEVMWLEPGVPAFRIVNTCREGRYRVEKEVVSDPRRSALLQSLRFVPLQGGLADYHCFVLLAPHLGNRGAGNTAWLGDYKGTPMLFAERDGNALALACSAPWLAQSAGYVGVSDGWQDLARHHVLTRQYARAENGNVALTGEVDLLTAEGAFTLALGFGRTAAEAGHTARASLLAGYDECRRLYTEAWREWQAHLPDPGPAPEGARDLHRTSAAVLRVHEAKEFPGGLIASLSIPWGYAKGDDDLGGYHLVWPRDLVESAGGLLAVGAHEDVRRALRYLETTQEADGSWAQNQWLDGTPYWTGVQMDETAFPVLLVDQALREGAVAPSELPRAWPMVRRAAGFLVRNGPVTQQDRWEEDPGYSPSTLAVEVAALLAAADLADRAGDSEVAAYLRETADGWNDGVERWTYVSGTDLAREAGVEGYYVRIAPPDVADASSPTGGYVPIKNRPPGSSSAPAEHVVSPDALALVRFGLRAPDDPRIVSTVKVIDRLLRVDTPSGESWHRYNLDGYGEHEDGSAFDGTGIGRAWPLLTGERAHYELAAGNAARAAKLAGDMAELADEGGLIPEQVWDAPDLPDRELCLGRPSGSARPLVWAHAEYVKLRRSLRDGRVFDMPPQPVERYQVRGTAARFAPWRFNLKARSMLAGRTLRVEVLASATVHWSADGWTNITDTPTRDTGLGVHVADLDTASLPAGGAVSFTFHWLEAGHWEGEDFAVRVV